MAAAMLLLGCAPLFAHTRALPENRVGVVEAGNAGFVRCSAFVTSTLHRSCEQICDEVPVGAVVGLDYFGARYFSGAQGRFTSPDPKMFPHNITDPQSWNKYSYTRNNPLALVDPDGRDWQSFKAGIGRAWTNTLQGWRTAARAVGFGFTTIGQGLSENQGFSFSTISFNDLNNIGKNLTLGVAMGEIGAIAEAPAGEAAAATAAEAMSVSESGTVSLFRAVDTTELGSIERNNAFLPSPNGSEEKGFFFNRADAQSFGDRMTAITGDQHSVVSTGAPIDIVKASRVHSAATEGPGVYIEHKNLPKLDPPKLPYN